jgi:hypothetical protein
MDYSSLTDTLNGLIQSDTHPWTNIPGGLEKVSESSSGAAWGLGSGKLYACLLPCTGQWNPIEFTPNFNVIDFTTDDTTVYVLGSNVLASKNGNNSGEWTYIPISVSLTELFNTGSYLWGQNGTTKWKLAKPGTTANWIQSPETTVKITSASMTTLYGIKAGKAVKTDESLQSSWQTIPQFKGVFTGILGDADQSGVYGIDAQNQVQKCLNGDCSSVPLEGTLKHLSVKPKKLWMTTETDGQYGNVFYKDDLPSDLIERTQPVDQERDLVVQETEHEYQQTTYSTMMYKQLEIIKKMFEDMFPNKPPPPETPDLTGEIKTVNRATNVVFEILLLLGVLILIYFFSGILGYATHYIAFVAVIVGVYIISNGL